MSPVQINIKLRVFGPKVGDAAPDLGELSVNGTLSLPVEEDAVHVMALAMRDAIKSMWESHYGTDMATSDWFVTVVAERGDLQVFEDAKSESLPLDFSVTVFMAIRTLIERAVNVLS